MPIPIGSEDQLKISKPKRITAPIRAVAERVNYYQDCLPKAAIKDSLTIAKETVTIAPAARPASTAEYKVINIISQSATDSRRR